MLVTLGVMPVGVADTKGYTNWVTAAKLDAVVKESAPAASPASTRSSPCRPDLVVIATDESANTIAQLEKFVPVLVTAARRGATRSRR